MITKFDSQETKRKQLQHYQALLSEHSKEYRRIGHQLYRDDTVQSTLKILIQIVNHLEDMDIELQKLYKNDTGSLYKTIMPLALKNWLLLAKIKKSMMVLNGCLIIKRPDDAPEPSFENIKQELSSCMDAVVFYKGSVFYANPITKILQALTIPDNKQTELQEFCMHYSTQTLNFATPHEIVFIETLTGVKIDKRSNDIDYVYLIKNAEEHFPTLPFKNDEIFQMEMYYALTEAAIQMSGNKKDEVLISRFPFIMETFINKCDDNVVKLSYYYSLILKEIEYAPPTKTLSIQVKENGKIFFEIHRKLINKLDRLQEGNKLDTHQKIAYIKANFFAHYVRMNTHVSLQGNKIIEALKDPNDKKNDAFIRKYIEIANIEREVYFANLTQILLCQDMQEIIQDMQAMYEYLEITQQVCTALTNQISIIMQWWFNIRLQPEFKYKEDIYQQARRYKMLRSHYYACYDLINNYLTKGDGSRRINPDFDENQKETMELFKVLKQERMKISSVDTVFCANFLVNTKNHEKELLSMDAKNSRTPKPSRKKVQTVSIDKEKIEQKTTRPKLNDLKQEINEIDRAMEEGQVCINKRDEKGAVANFWKAYNLATHRMDVKRKLQAMDCLCYIAGVQLSNHLKCIESLAKIPNKKKEFESEALTLLSDLPKLKNTYELYFQLATAKQDSLLPQEQEGIAYSRDLFWKQVITVQSKIKMLLEQHTKKNPNLEKKQSYKSNTNKLIQADTLKSEDNLHLALEKHFDDLASERVLGQMVNKINSPQHIKITLPHNIQCIFEFLASFKGTHYLVGSMVVQLLLKEFNQLPIVAHDADFISTCMDRASLIIAGFQENSYMRNLYSLFRRFEWSIDLIALPEEYNWLMNSLCSRDFRVAALSCDKEGTIIDSTGYGIEDLKARRLVMIGCPKERFKQDPVLLLRTLKYMVFGFKPDDLLLQALHSWQPQPDINFSKLFAVTRKHLLKPDEAGPFLDLLCQFNFLDKMFNLKDKEGLMQMLGLSPREKSPLCQQSLFKLSSKENQSENHSALSQNLF